MARSKKDTIADQAAETTNALSPIVGVHRSELLNSFGTFFKTAAMSPMTFSAHMLNYSKDMWDIVKGDSEMAPENKDRRFMDTTWKTNPFYRRGMQSWLALRKNLHAWLGDLEMDAVDHARTAFVMDVISDALAPTNSLVGNPTAMKRLFESGGLSVIKGLQNAYDDMVNGNGLPRQVDERPFKIGENIVTTPGKVVYQTELFELIQYSPSTPEVHKVPLLFVPPQINKFYCADLTPEKSMFKFLVDQGFQLFCVSWRNAQVEHAHWGLETYVDGLIEVTDAIMSITRQKKVNVFGACSGGITLSTMLSHLAHEGDERIGAVSLMVCVLDPRQEDSEVGAFVTDETLELARKQSQKKGILSGDDLSRTFAWLRPNDLIWNYVVNNYLLGEEPPAFDILFWNNDSTNLPAQLHSDYLDSYKSAPFANPGTVEFKGHPLDLGAVKNDVFMLAGMTDHITPWRACYRSAKLLGGKVWFNVSNSGHIQSLINPPQNPKARYLRGADITKKDWSEWVDAAEDTQGSWWLEWISWLEERSGGKKKAPTKCGNSKYKAGEDAPGAYILD